MIRVTRLCCGVALSIGLLAGWAYGARILIPGVPDWNQPQGVDGNLPDPGPVGVVNSPVNGTTNAWCTPTAAGNIMGYYRDKVAGLTIADGSVFPVTTARAPNAADWRDDILDTLTQAPNSRGDLGWYMNTNNEGDQTVPIHAAMAGTHDANIRPGLVNYFAAHGKAPSVVNYADLAGAAAAYDNSGVGAPHTVPLSYQRIKTEINASRPLLLHLSYWALQNRLNVRGGGPSGMSDFDYAQWGTSTGSGPNGEVYVTDIGHTVTLVGYWDGADLNNPFVGLGNGGTTPDAVIVYDNNDGTLGAAPNAVALPLVLPYSIGELNAGLNVPWVMQTEISNVPEPMATCVLGVGALILALRRRR